jgi:aromatic ring-opening dioxygenase LigB subunit
MPIISSYILPHGALSLNPSKYPEMKDLTSLHKSCVKISEDIYSLKPDVIVLTTPHGINLTKSFGVYLNSNAEGSAEWQGSWKDYTIKIKIEIDDSKELLKILEEKNIPSEGIISYADDEPLPLRWGEVIPIWFISQPYNNYTMVAEVLPKFIIISIPRKRLTNPESMIDESLLLGREIHNYFSKSNKKVVTITSADLAHTHTVNIENINLTDEADLFDKSIELWARNPLENENILLNASKIVTKYLSCGYIGFVILQGILKEIKTKIIQNVLINTHPTYYGMMVAKFNYTQ